MGGMALFGRRRVPRRLIGRYRPTPSAAPPALEQLVEDSRLVAHSATRMAVKNRLIMDAAGHRLDFDASRLRAEAQETLEQLAQQQRAAADYEAETGGDPRRGPVLRALADQLEEDARDRELLTEMVEAARDAAWSELSASLTRKLRLTAEQPHVDPDYLAGREERIAALKAVDLRQLGWLMHDRFAETGSAPSAGAAPPATADILPPVVEPPAAPR